MGVITLTLIVAGYQPANTGPQVWVILACGLAIAAGTYIGGWRIIRTVGKRITDVKSPQGFAAETSAAATILISSTLGFPLSTTQVTSGAVVGAGVGKKLASVHWGMVGKIATAWIITLPCAALFGGLAAWLASTSTVGLVIVIVLAAALVGFFIYLAKRNPINSTNVNDVDEQGNPIREPETVGSPASGPGKEA